jgi:uncharacterized protein (TIGR00661 family)
MDIVYGVCSWGLGHATRSLPLIRKLISEDHNLTIITSGRTLKLLQREIKDDAQYMDVPDYPILISEDAKRVMVKSLVYWPSFIRRMQVGLAILTKLLQRKNYDMILSDGRYDMYNKKIPSFFISHQMRIMNPLRIKFLETASELFNHFFFKRFYGVLVPDYRQDDLSGDLSHNLKLLDENRLHYVGILSDFKRRKTKKDIDYLVSLSGPELQRKILEKKLLSQLEGLKGKIVVTLGKAEATHQKSDDNIRVYSYLSKEKREEILNRTKLVISRSGYSTIMDLAVINTKALMIPTPGQIEQQYLAEYNTVKEKIYSVNQSSIDLKRDIELAKKTKGLKMHCSAEKTIENIMNVIMSASKN